MSPMPGFRARAGRMRSAGSFRSPTSRPGLIGMACAFGTRLPICQPRQPSKRKPHRSGASFQENHRPNERGAISISPNVGICRALSEDRRTRQCRPRPHTMSPCPTFRAPLAACDLRGMKPEPAGRDRSGSGDCRTQGPSRQPGQLTPARPPGIDPAQQKSPAQSRASFRPVGG